MRLGLTLGYWGRAMPEGLVELATEAERAGFDAAWAGESWGSDAFSPLVLIAAATERIRERLQAWEESPVTMLNVAARSEQECRRAVELVKG